jgi:alpha-L-fucosidase 2
VKPGREVAQSYYGTPGWVSHSIGNIWGYAAPGSEITWGMYPAAAAWHCHTLWEHFVYGKDKDYLRSMAYPVMKEAAEFWLENLVPYENGLITAPSVSAEHGPSVACKLWEVLLTQRFIAYRDAIRTSRSFAIYSQT